MNAAAYPVNLDEAGLAGYIVLEQIVTTCDGPPRQRRSVELARGTTEGKAN